MTKLTREQIKEIAEQLDCGFSCYCNIKTNALLYVPHIENNLNTDLDAWAEDLEKIKKERRNYKTIDPPKSSDTFELMLRFIKTLPEDSKLRSILTQALAKRKPFQEFKFAIDNSGDYRQQWFDFKNEMLVEWVKSELKYFDVSDE